MIGISLGALLLTGLTVWMCWRIVEKAGWPGWWSLTHLLAFTGIGMLANLLFFWVLAFARWPRDDQYVGAGAGPMPQHPGPRPAAAQAAPTASHSPAQASPPPLLVPPPARLPAPSATPVAVRHAWTLEGRLPDGRPGRLAIDDSKPVWVLGGTAGAADLVVPDPSVGTPHARLLTAPGRLGLEDLGSEGGTWIDGVRLLPAHGPRDISQSQRLRFGAVELMLSPG